VIDLSRNPVHRSLTDPKRHLFHRWDRQQFFKGVPYALALCGLCFWAFGAAFLPIGLIWFWLRARRLHRLARDPWYFPIAQRVRYEQLDYRHGRTLGARLGPRFNRWTVKRDALLTRRWTWREWLHTIVFGSGNETRRWRLSWMDKPLFGIIPTPILALSPWSTRDFPTGREIMHSVKQRYPRAYRTFFVDDPAEALEDRLPWRSKPDPRTVRNRNETFTRSWLVYGYDYSLHPKERASRVKGPFNAAIAKLPAGYVVHTRAVQTESERTYLTKLYGTEAADLVGTERRDAMEDATLCDGWTEVHLTYVPSIAETDATDDDERAERQARRKKDIVAASEEAYFEFLGVVRQFEASIKTLFRRFVPAEQYDRIENGRYLKCDRQFELFDFALTGKRRPFPALPNNRPAYEVFGRHRLQVRDRYLRIDDMLVGVLEIYDYPSETTPDMFLFLEGTQDATVAICQRFIVRRNPEVEAEMDKAFKEDAQRAEGIPTVRSMLHKGAATPPDLHAQRKLSASAEAKAEHRDAIQVYGHASNGIIVYEAIGEKETEEQAAERLLLRLAEMTGALEHHLFTVATNNGNQLEAFCGWMPGNWYDNAVGSLLSSGNVTNLAITAHPWVGDDYIVETADAGGTEYYRMRDGGKAPCLAWFVAEGRRLFGFSPQRGSRGGHVLATGGTGAGKSTIMDYLLVEHSGYNAMLVKGSREIIIDYDGSHRATGFFMRAQVITFGAEAAGFAIFADVGTPQGDAFAEAFLKRVLVKDGLEPNSDKMNEAIAQMLECAKNMPQRDRSLENVVQESIVDNRIKKAITRYCPSGGSYGNLFNGVEPMIPSRGMIVLDVVDPFRSEVLRDLVMFCLAHEIDIAATEGVPTMLLIEELWALMQDENTQEYMDAWMSRLRKFGVWMFLITQNVADLYAMPKEKRRKFLDNFATYMIFPSDTIASPESKEILLEIGLEGWECDYLRSQAPDPETGSSANFVAYIVKGRLKRLVSTFLHEMAQTVCGNTSVARREQISNLAQEFMEPDKTLAAWILQRGNQTKSTAAAGWYTRFTQVIVPKYRALRSEAGVSEEATVDPRLLLA
jgi:hypothetical protein